ncbi:MAG TPA: hypothetical protein VMS98_09565 [Thermoanaerobaculia bacterium]|nr:hypothetical protein [Thermoanaerobaculia bacterium]
MTLRSNQEFDEIRVFEGVAERTGQVVDRKTVRGSAAVCRSLTDLTRAARRLGDGYFYLPVMMWPEGVTRLPLAATWTTMS